MSEYGYVKFTGEYAKLKEMGFEFQKLYASNYMQWSKNGFRVWKRGGDITHDDCDLYKLITFLETKPICRTGSKHITFFKVYDNKGNDYCYHPFDDEHIKQYRDVMDAWGKVNDDTHEDKLPPQWTTQAVTNDTLELLKEWKEMGWWELAEYSER